MPTGQPTFGRLNGAVSCLNNQSHYSHRAPAKGDKAPAKPKVAAAAANGATAAAVSLKQLAAGLAESHDLPKRQVETMLGEFVQSLAEHL